MKIKKLSNSPQPAPATRYVCLFLALLLTGCATLGGAAPGMGAVPTMVQGTPLPTFSGVIDPAVIGSAPAPFLTSAPPVTTTPGASSGWTALAAAGMEYKQLSIPTGGIGSAVMAVRIDPTRATFKVFYTPGVAHTINEWQAALPGVALILNGNYFDTSTKALGLVVSDNVLYGASSQRSDAGLFQVLGGLPRVRSLWLEPLNGGERFDQAAQGFPILTVQGQPAPINPDLDQGSSRRTVVATDKLGRVLFIVTPTTGCTLADMANWLAASGLDIDTALNLDGGRSSALYLATGGAGQFAPGFGPTPIVLAVYPR